MHFLVAVSLIALALPATSVAADAAATSVPTADVHAGQLAAPHADKAQVVFLDPSNAIANAFAPSVYDVTASPRVFIAKLGAHVNASTLVEPGHHRFMVRTIDVTQFLDADVEAGHCYYVLARFVYGRGFQLRPLRPGTGARASSSEYSAANPQFKTWLEDATWLTHSAEMLPGTDAARFAAKLDERQAIGLSEWSSKTAEQKDELTLKPLDAIDDPKPPFPGIVLREATVPLPGPLASVAPADPGGPAATRASRQADMRHLDAQALAGRTWTFPHLRDPARFGQVELRFVGDRVQGRNALSHSEGRYVVNDDRVCVDFESTGWPQVCYYVRDIPSATGGTPTTMVVNAATGAAAPLAIR